MWWVKGGLVQGRMLPGRKNCTACMYRANKDEPHVRWSVEETTGVCTLALASGSLAYADATHWGAMWAGKRETYAIVCFALWLFWHSVHRPIWSHIHRHEFSILIIDPAPEVYTRILNWPRRLFVNYMTYAVLGRHRLSLQLTFYIRPA